MLSNKKARTMRLLRSVVGKRSSWSLSVRGEFCACMDVSLPFQSRKCAMCVSSRCRTLNLPKESPESETQTEDPEDPVMEVNRKPGGGGNV